MSLRIACSTFRLCIPQRAVGTNKFVITKILTENLIEDVFSVKEMSNILCGSERTFRDLRYSMVKNQEFPVFPMTSKILVF